MTPQLPKRFWFEATLGVLSTALLVLTLAWPEWIEGAFGVDPDGGSGALEWAIALGMVAITLVAFTLAMRDWRRIAR